MSGIRIILKIQEPRNGIQFVIYPETREELKPIVFFDAGNFVKDDDGFTIDFHPHSGIGIITYFHGTDLHHRDSGKNDGVIHDGGVQWIRAGGGVWHQEGYHRKHNQPTGTWKGSIHQLWLQLPPKWEESEVEYNNLSKEEIPQVGNVKILAGTYKGLKGKLSTPFNITYLDVELTESEEWVFDTPKGQTTGFIFPRGGDLIVNNQEVPNQKMGILDHNEGVISVKAKEGTGQFILVIAEPSEHPVKVYGSSIHTNEEAYLRSRERIQELGKNI